MKMMRFNEDSSGEEERGEKTPVILFSRRKSET
jgi:hypothetical protein